MELIKSNVHMNKIIRKETTTFYVNRECNITEGNPKINEIIGQKESVTVDRVSVRNGQVFVNGTVMLEVMYSSEEKALAWGVEEDIPFEEVVRVVGLEDDCKADVQVVVSSSNIKIMDDRTYIYKVQLIAYITIERLQDLETISASEEDGIMIKQKDINTLAIVEDKKENFRVHERISLATNKQPIERIIWKELRIKNLDTKVLEGIIDVKGELQLFILYCPQDFTRQQWIETTIPFEGKLEAMNALEGMLSYIDVQLNNVNIEPVMDQDNLMRDLEIDAVLRFNIKVYCEQEVMILEDVYSPNCNLIPVVEEQVYEKLLVKNEARTKNVVKLTVPEDKGNVLQICNSSNQIKIENVFVGDNVIKVAGKVKVCVMYIPSDDGVPVCCLIKESDFEHPIDAEGITPEDRFYINWRMEQVNANMTSSNEIEVKSVIAMEVMAFREEQVEFVKKINEEPINVELLNAIPMLKGYVVKSGDTLWSLAKENFTTIEKIMEINNLDSDNIKKGDKLLLAKTCQ